MRKARTILNMKPRIITPGIPLAEEMLSPLIRRVGHSESLPVSSELATLIQKALAEALQLARPRAISRVSSVERIEKDAIIGRGLCIESERCARLCSLMDSPAILLAYAVTLGDDLDRKITSLQKESLSLAFVLDAAGSEIVERVADRMEEDLWKALDRDGFQRTARFSPGYCDWELAGQQEIFEFLHPEQIGIHHTRAWSMLPSKSITAVLLGAKAMPFDNACPLCSKKGCTYRRGVAP